MASYPTSGPTAVVSLNSFEVEGFCDEEAFVDRTQDFCDATFLSIVTDLLRYAGACATQAPRFKDKSEALRKNA